jgi:hypothetical protein
MKISVLFAGVWATCCVPFGLAQTAPNPPNQLCNLETVYDSIKTGNVVDVTLEVRYRHCPSNTDNLPCRVASTDPNQGFAPGPLLDGVESQLIMINDSSPGPTIRAKLGDTVRVTVVNYLQEPTTMHFHGITQFGTPFMDGADGITQCAIAQGYTQTYEFIAHPAGTTFYHSHTGSQRVGGMTGPLIIEDPADDESYDDKVVFFQDWFHDRPDSAFNFWAENHRKSFLQVDQESFDFANTYEYTVDLTTHHVATFYLQPETASLLAATSSQAISTLVMLEFLLLGRLLETACCFKALLSTEKAFTNIKQHKSQTSLVARPSRKWGALDRLPIRLSANSA